MIEGQMEIKVRDSNAERIKTDLLVIPVREKKLDDALIRTVDRRLRGNLRARMQKSKFTGAEGGTLIYQTAGLLPAAQVLLIGLGGGAEIAGDTWRKIGARARREAAALGAGRHRIFLFAR
jgi:Cytosol aminopeptidase family, N-terminal domain.